MTICAWDVPGGADSGFGVGVGDGAGIGLSLGFGLGVGVGFGFGRQAPSKPTASRITAAIAAARSVRRLAIGSADKRQASTQVSAALCRSTDSRSSIGRAGSILRAAPLMSRIRSVIRGRGRVIAQDAGAFVQLKLSDLIEA